MMPWLKCCLKHIVEAANGPLSQTLLGNVAFPHSSVRMALEDWQALGVVVTSGPFFRGTDVLEIGQDISQSSDISDLHTILSSSDKS